MDYRTLYIFDVVLLALYAAALLVLALKNRRMTGMAWFATSATFQWVSALLHALNGALPSWLTVLCANQVSILSFFAMYMGFHWFVLRNTLRRRRTWLLFAPFFGLYVLLCLTRSWHILVASLSPGLILGAMTAWLLLRHGKGHFRVASRVASLVLFVQVGFQLYCSVFAVRLFQPNMAGAALSDPRWLYNLFAIMFIGVTTVLIYGWFFVIESHHELRTSALTDPLTGIFNRRGIIRESEREISLARRARRPISFIAIDLDHFKSINDRYGHKGGDIALCALATLLRRELRETDLIARLGGEEFAVVLPETNLSGALHIAEKLCHSLATTPIHLPGNTIQMTFTAGVAQFIASDLNFDSIMERADKALYRGKTAGRNRVVVAEPHAEPPPVVSISSTVHSPAEPADPSICASSARLFQPFRTPTHPALAAWPPTESHPVLRLCRRLFSPDRERLRNHRIPATPETYTIPEGDAVPESCAVPASQPMASSPAPAAAVRLSAAASPPPPFGSLPVAPLQSPPSHCHPRQAASKLSPYRTLPPLK